MGSLRTKHDRHANVHTSIRYYDSFYQFRGNMVMRLSRGYVQPSCSITASSSSTTNKRPAHKKPQPVCSVHCPGCQSGMWKVIVVYPEVYGVLGLNVSEELQFCRCQYSTSSARNIRGYLKDLKWLYLKTSPTLVVPGLQIECNHIVIHVRT